MLVYSNLLNHSGWGGGGGQCFYMSSSILDFMSSKHFTKPAANLFLQT